MICVGFLLFLHPHKFIHIEDNIDSSNIDIGKGWLMKIQIYANIILIHILQLLLTK